MSVGSNRLMQALGAARSAGETDRNIIVVYPFSEGRRGSRTSTAYKNGYDSYWMKEGNSTNDSMHVLHDEFLQTAKAQFNADITCL